MTATDLVPRVAAHGLQHGAAIAEEELPEEDFDALLAACTGERIVGLLAAAVHEGALPVNDRQREALIEQHGAFMTRALAIEEAALDAIDLLGEAGVPTRVLKGLATAHLDLPDPSWRTFVDVDLLVPSARLTQAVELLVQAYRGRDLVERRVGFDERFGKDVTVYGPGVELDIHRTLALGAFGLWIDLDELWAEHECFTLGGQTLMALDRPRRFVHACLGATLGDPRPRLSTLRDLLTILSHPSLDVDHVRSLAADWRCEAVVAHSIRTATRILGSERPNPMVAWAQSNRPALRERAALKTYPSMGGSNTACILSGVLALSPAASAAYLHAWLRPDRKYRAVRKSRHRPAEVRTGLRELAGIVRPRR